MGFNCGIVGLPNVGKSTLFNALTASAAAEASNYPFCTIEPNLGKVEVADARLDRIAAIVKPARVIPTTLGFVDIAGLVKGSSQGEGLGNRFLSHIREVEAVIHVLRCFEDDNVSHVAGAIDPLSDAATVATEMMLADLESLEKRRQPLIKKIRGDDQEAKAKLALVERTLEALGEGRPAGSVAVAEDQKKTFQGLHLLTAKPILYVCNVDEDSAADGNAWSAAVGRRAGQEGAASVVVSAKIEEEIAALAEAAERAEFLDSLGLGETGLARVVGGAYSLLSLITFFTFNEKEARAWTLREGSKAPRAAGAVHTDFEAGFIRAETIAYDDFIALGGDHAAREAGKMRAEGRDYLVQDGDIMLFRFKV